jgi:hypothetical protein
MLELLSKKKWRVRMDPKNPNAKKRKEEYTWRGFVAVTSRILVVLDIIVIVKCCFV